jgi:heptosyltransferase-2
VSLAAAVRKEWGLKARFALSPGEPEHDRELLRLLGDGAEHAVGLDVRALAALAEEAAAIVSNDSGILHLGPALGVPAVGLFGSTVPAFGFALQGSRDAVAEVPLACRPCGVHGRSSCPLGHHACMELLTPEIALDALRPVLAAVAAS